MTKEQYDQHSRIFTEAGCDPIVSIEEHIQYLIDRIIATMYIPVPDESQFIAEPVGKIKEDAINWGKSKMHRGKR